MHQARRRLMFNPTKVLIEAFAECLQHEYCRAMKHDEPGHLERETAMCQA
jgi:hypothetical protein